MKSNTICVFHVSPQWSLKKNILKFFFILPGIFDINVHSILFQHATHWVKALSTRGHYSTEPFLTQEYFARLLPILQINTEHGNCGGCNFTVYLGGRWWEQQQCHQCLWYVNQSYHENRVYVIEAAILYMTH